MTRLGTGTETWWPSRYGAEDQAGALNEVTAEKVRQGSALVRRGRVFDLAHVLDEHIPAFPGRTFRQRLNAQESLPAGSANDVRWIVEHVDAPSQMGTHMDGLNHLHIGDRAYNGHRIADIAGSSGTSRLGIETLPQVVTRGVLCDIAAVRGVDHLGQGDVITPADAEAALSRRGLSVERGDAVLFHTGWGRYWGVDDVYVAGEPGPGLALGRWLADHRVAMTGCDTWSFGPVPPEDPDRPFEVPQILNAHHGIVVLENLRLDDLAAAGASEFCFVVSHAKLRGATGAWVAPLAVI